MNQQIPFEVGEALRYFRAAPDDSRAVDLVDRAYGLLRPELQPRYTARRIACRTEGQGTMADCVVLDGGIVFHSKALARYVGGSRELFLFGATLGSRIDRRYSPRSQDTGTRSSSSSSRSTYSSHSTSSSGRSGSSSRRKF